MFSATPSPSLSVFLVLLVCSLFCNSDASIKVVNLGREYQSRTDKYVGLQMKIGVEYGARLQRFRDDSHLCGRGQRNVTVPDGGRPVALLVKKGLCSYAQKAEFASRNIHPPGIVKVLIIDGEGRIDDEYDDDDEVTIEHAFNKSDDDYRDDNSSISSYEFPAYYNWNNKSTTFLRRKKADDISVVLLHVSYRTGVELLDVILNEVPEVRNQGGTLLKVDGVVPPMARTSVIIWTAVCACISLLLCCCLASIIEDVMEAIEEEPEPPRRPRRQRLTIDQVRKVPIGIFDGTQLVYHEESTDGIDSAEDFCRRFIEPPNNSHIQPADHLLDTCTICLDDYDIGDKLRCLPCGHAFHANCIAKWLIERSATCPLCKIDLYEEEDDIEDGVEEQQPQPQNHTSPTISAETPERATPSESSGEPWWRNLFRSREQQRTVSEAFTQPLLQQQEQSENVRSEVASIQETSTSEEHVLSPTNHGDETIDE